MANFFLTSLVLFSLFPIYVPIFPSEILTTAIDTLSGSGFVSMSLTLQLVSQTLIFSSPTATIFAPSDTAFINSGQPSLNLLQYHLSPVKFSTENLKSLPFGTKIPTLIPNKTLMVTTSDFNGQISLNNVKINDSAILDIGSLSIFAIDDFFDPSFQVSTLLPPAPSPSANLECKNPFSDNDNSVKANASAAMSSQGFSVMASFLDLQLPGISDTTKMTIFAPVDEALEQFSSNFSSSSVFHRHFLPCRLTGSDLFNLDDGITLQTLSEGFTIKLTKSGDALALNDVPVIFPDIYSSDSIVVHGLQQIITLPIGDSDSVLDDSHAKEISDFYGDFKG